MDQGGLEGGEEESVSCQDGQGFGYGGKGGIEEGGTGNQLGEEPGVGGCAVGDAGV